jgi:hypothetical protein
LGALAGHLSIGALTSAEGTTQTGSSFANLQDESGSHAELNPDIGAAHAAGDAATLGHADGASGSVSTAHLEVGSFGIEDAALHTGFSTQMHL